MQIKMSISAMVIDPMTNMPIVLLKDEKGENTLPIWIGLLEASAIATELEGIELSRPMTHDLFKNVLSILDVTIEKIVLSDLMDNTYYARIFLKHGDKTHEIDARPSDSMALALRTKAPIFVDEKVIQASQKVDVSQTMEISDKDKMMELLENLDPASFGKYKM